MRDLKTKLVDTPFGRLSLIEQDVVSRTLEEGHHWNPHVYAALEGHLDGLVVDVGANVGALTMRFAQVAPAVVAYEPHPILAACLQQNMETLGLASKVTIWSMGLYSKRTRLAPWASFEGEDPSSWAWLPDPDGEAIAGPHIDTGDRISAIKVDAQGADLHALIGLAPAIRRDRPWIVFEYEGGLSGKHGHTWHDYLHQFTAWDYQLQDIGEGDHLAYPKEEA